MIDCSDASRPGVLDVIDVNGKKYPCELAPYEIKCIWDNCKKDLSDFAGNDNIYYVSNKCQSKLKFMKKRNNSNDKPDIKIDYEEYNSHNTKRLNVNEIKEKLLGLDFIKASLKN